MIRNKKNAYERNIAKNRKINPKLFLICEQRKEEQRSNWSIEEQRRRIYCQLGPRQESVPGHEY